MSTISKKHIFSFFQESVQKVLLTFVYVLLTRYQYRCLILCCLQVREKNLYYEGDSTHYCQPLSKCMIRRCWEECVRQSDFHRRKKDVDIFNRYASDFVVKILPMFKELTYGYPSLSVGTVHCHYKGRQE